MRSAVLIVSFCAASWLLQLQAGEQPSSKTSATRPDLRNELLHRMEIDQSARKAYLDWISKLGDNGSIDLEKLNLDDMRTYEEYRTRLTEIDEENTRWMKSVVDEQGWPTISMVGEEGSKAAWLLVQHADRDVKFQRKSLDLMLALPEEEVLAIDVAYLTDRVLVAEGKPQLYGTQFHVVDGKLEPRSIDAESKVDARRQKVGLSTLAEYREQVGNLYRASLKK